MKRRWSAVLLGVVVQACGGAPSGADAGDAGTVVDAGRDAGTPDAGPVDAGPNDAGRTDAGLDAGVSDAGGPADAGRDGGLDGGADAGSGDGGLALTPGQWQWFDQPGSRCDDGSLTGIGVNAGTSGALVLFFAAGGACWDQTTCEVLNTSVHGPYGAAQFAQATTALSRSPLFDRSSASNPYRDDSYVVFPSCTGDLGLGEVERVYTDGGTRVFHHWGRANLLAALPALSATFGAASRVAIIGASSSAPGVVFNYPLLRDRWPAAAMVLVSDSFPLLVGDGISPVLRQAWTDAWGLGPVLTQACDGGCANDFSAVYRALARRYPDDRFGLLTSLQDQVQRSLLGVSGGGYQPQIELLRSAVLEPSGWRSFVIGGTSHALIGTATASVDGGTVLGWLRQQLDFDAGWSSVGP